MCEDLSDDFCTDIQLLSSPALLIHHFYTSYDCMQRLRLSHDKDDDENNNPFYT